MFSYLKFRYQRTLRRWHVQIRTYVRQYLFGKWRQLAMVRRFVFSWALLLVILGYGVIFQIQSLRAQTEVQQPVRGGEYSEALVGKIGSLNPILPENTATSDVNKLLFRGLMAYNQNGEIETDLASSWSVSGEGKIYTFHLRHGVKWHDNVPFTAQDVVFTLAAIQNPDTRSPLASSWHGVKVQAVDDYTVVYTLPKIFTPFINATTVGLIPRHLLENVDPRTLRLAPFNQNPVGLGPYRVRQVDSQAGKVSLAANDGFYGGAPSIRAITFLAFHNYAEALSAYHHRQVLAVGHVPVEQAAAVRRVSGLVSHELTLPTEVGAFFHTSGGILSDKNLRQGLALASNRSEIVEKDLHDEAAALASPLLPSPLSAGLQRQPSENLLLARTTLESSGWKVSTNGIRSKDGQPLRLVMVTQSGTVYSRVAQRLKQQWRRVGVDVVIKLVDGSELQQSYIRPRHYDVLLYGINVGPDEDVYAYWHSSQAADPGLNVSSYSVPAADKALEAGRTLTDGATRAAKYKAFAATWMGDTPAVMLYSPTYAYAQDAVVQGLKAHKLIDPADRFYDIQHWTVRSRTVGG